MELYIKAQAERVHHNYAEIAILLKQYSGRCTRLMRDPESRMQELLAAR